MQNNGHNNIADYFVYTNNIAGYYLSDKIAYSSKRILEDTIQKFGLENINIYNYLMQKEDEILFAYIMTGLWKKFLENRSKVEIVNERNS